MAKEFPMDRYKIIWISGLGSIDYHIWLQVHVYDEVINL